MNGSRRRDWLDVGFEWILRAGLFWAGWELLMHLHGLSPHQ